tara:strand:- start:9427 stop:10980 length:1554 start_codon:yes stop_codon:yes gene_type:complete
MGEEQKKVKKPKSAVGQEVGYSFPRLNNPDLKGSPFTDDKYISEFKNKNFTHFYESPDKMVRAGIKHLGDNRYAVDHYGVREDMQEQGIGREGLKQLRNELEAFHGGPVEMIPTSITQSSQGFWDKMQSENITNMLKEAKSPAAIKHKRKYETQYESSPARKKYRRELERERRKRGVAGKGGKDMSHTKTGKIVPEDPHTNRARSHPSVGSTLKMVVVKAPRIPRKKGQPANSKKHSDLYTDENPKGTIHGLGFKNPAKARQSVAKIKNSSRSHAHKTQAAIAMEQRAKEMGKKKEAGVYRNFIESQKKKTKQLKKAPQMNLSGQSAECELCGAMMNAQEVSVSNQQMGASVCTACLLQEQQRINQEADDAMMYHGEPMEITMQSLKTPRILKDENDGHGYPCRFCNSGRVAQYNAYFDEPRCMECIERRVDELMPSLDELNEAVNQPRFDSNFQDIYTGEPMDIAMRLLKDFNTCYQCGQTWEQLGLANATPFQRSLHEDRCMGMQTSEKDAMFQQ